MDVLESCPKHNMVAYLEKTDGNIEFHELSSFLREAPFTMLSLYITAKVAGKPVSILEASIRSDLLFNDADGIDSLPNQAIFDAIQLMGYEGDLTLKNVPVPLDHFPINALTSKVYVTDQAKEIKHLKAQIKKLKKKAKPVITHHRAWMKSVSMKQRLAGKKSLKKQWMQKEFCNPIGRKSAKIDSKDKGKKKIEEEDESDTESEGITKAEKKFKQLVRDEEVARKVQEDWEAEEEVKKQRLFLAQQRSEAIRNKPPSRNQLRNQMMTYLKHVGGKKHSDLKTKSFEEIKALYDKIKMSDDSFIAIGSAEDEKVIKEMNEQVA
ncbi:hypothetical protein Tco_0397284 [Tanacetum coccineum]